MAEPKKHSPAPWKASQGKITDANGDLIGTYLDDDDPVHAMDGAMMAAAPELMVGLMRSEGLIKLINANIIAVIRHETDTPQVLTSLTDLANKLDERLRQVLETLGPLMEN